MIFSTMEWNSNNSGSVCAKSPGELWEVSQFFFAIHLFQIEQKVSKQLNYSDYPLTNERLQMRVNY